MFFKPLLILGSEKPAKKGKKKRTKITRQEIEAASSALEGSAAECETDMPHTVIMVATQKRE